MQQDYRANPSLGGADLSSQHAGDYSDPMDDGSIAQSPPDDLSFKYYDGEKSDADFDRFRPISIKGWSPDRLTP